jgi:hypothetical protein
VRRRWPLAIALVACADDPSSPSGSSGGGSSSSSSASSSSSGSGGSTANALCVATINEYRATVGLGPYRAWTAGEACAAGQAQKDAQTNTPHGAFPGCGELAQNECPNHPAPPEAAVRSCLRLMWSEGPGGPHYRAMASAGYAEVACGIHVTASGKIWVVQNFR